MVFQRKQSSVELELNIYGQIHYRPEICVNACLPHLCMHCSQLCVSALIKSYQGHSCELCEWYLIDLEILCSLRLPKNKPMLPLFCCHVPVTFCIIECRHCLKSQNILPNRSVLSIGILVESF